MEQRAVLCVLMLKGLNPQQIHSELESVCHEDALALPTISKWDARSPDAGTELSDDPRSGRPRKSDLGQGCFSLLTERPVLSRKLLARHLRIAKATCLRILREHVAL
jgi:transposase